MALDLGVPKPGPPPRLLRRSIDFSKTEIQPGDEPVPYFSYWKDDLFHVEQSAPLNGVFREDGLRFGNGRSDMSVMQGPRSSNKLHGQSQGTSSESDPSNLSGYRNPTASGDLFHMEQTE